MKALLFLVTALHLSSCHKAQIMQTHMPCNKEQAVILTNKSIKKAGKNLEDLNITINEDANFIYVKYQLKNKMQLGGGGEFKVSKSDCRIIEGKLYQ